MTSKQNGDFTTRCPYWVVFDITIMLRPVYYTSVPTNQFEAHSKDVLFSVRAVKIASYDFVQRSSKYIKFIHIYTDCPFIKNIKYKHMILYLIFIYYLSYNLNEPI